MLDRNAAGVFHVHLPFALQDAIRALRPALQPRISDPE
jgi:hypothetical protein